MLPTESQARCRPLSKEYVLFLKVCSSYFNDFRFEIHGHEFRVSGSQATFCSPC